MLGIGIGIGIGIVIGLRRIQFDAGMFSLSSLVVLVVNMSDGYGLAEGAAVATAFGDVRSSSSSGAIGLDRDAGDGRRRTATERCRVGKVGWQVGSRVARPACCCSGSSAAAGIVARAGCLAGLATCMHTAFRRLVTAQP